MIFIELFNQLFNNQAKNQGNELLSFIFKFNQYWAFMALANALNLLSKFKKINRKINEQIFPKKQWLRIIRSMREYIFI